MCLIRLGRKGGREGGREEEEEQVTFSWLIDPMTPSPSSPPPLPPPVPKPHRQHHTGEAPAGGRDGFHDCRQRDRKHPARTRRLRLLVRYVAPRSLARAPLCLALMPSPHTFHSRLCTPFPFPTHTGPTTPTAARRSTKWKTGCSRPSLPPPALPPSLPPPMTFCLCT